MEQKKKNKNKNQITAITTAIDDVENNGACNLFQNVML